MSKPPSLDSMVIARKGMAAPAVTTGDQVTLQPSNEPRKEETKETTIQGRKRPWDGKDDPVKANFELPRRVQMKLAQLKAWDRIESQKEFVARTLEAAVDREIAKAEKEGY